MTLFEEGYKAFLDGIGQDENPYNGESAPYSRKRWSEGWVAARIRKAEQAR